MAFHRLAVPTYFNGLPGGYDYVNNALVGTPAVTPGPRADGGPNNGTYFLGFAENAVSQAVNRGLNALAENCDTLDDYLRRDIAVPAVTADETAVGTVSSIVLTGPVFIGMSGTPNTVAGIRSFVTLVDEEDNEIFNSTECQVTAITGGTVGDEWSTANITLTVSPAIPDGTIYRVYYSTRGNVATFPDDVLRGRRREYNRFNGGSAWADGTTNPATFITAQLDKIITDLAVGAGTGKIRGSAISGATYAVAAGTLAAQLAALNSSLNTEHASMLLEVATEVAAEAVARVAGDAAEAVARTAADSVLEASILAELVARRKVWGAIPALTFRTNFAAGYFNVIRYCSAFNTWFACDGEFTADYVRVHDDLWEHDGTAWTGATNVSIGATTGDYVWDMDVNQANGTLVVADNSTASKRVRTSDGTWTYIGPGGYDAQKPNIIYEPVSGNWIYAAQTTTPSILVQTSPTGVTWTDRTAPTFPAAAYVTLGHNGVGRVVMQAFDGATSYFSYSDDGGVTWSAPQTFPLGLTHAVLTGEHNPRPTWTGEHWVAIGLSATATCIMVSVDGITWTLGNYLSGTAIKSIAAIGGVIAGVSMTGRLVFSLDGATWRYGEGAYNDGVAAPRGIHAVGNRFIIVGWGYIWPGDGFGESGFILT